MSTCKPFAGLLLLTTALTLPTALRAQGAAGDAGAAPEAQAPSEQEVLQQVEGVDDAQAEAEEPDISIPGGGNTIVVTGRRTRDPTRNSTQVISVLSSEQIARTGEGDIAGALGRVTGLSLQGNGLVYVRGLGDRYSLALLNGLPLPSPQPLSRVVPLDIFPTSIVASSLVQKTYSANFPGEFGGGVINLTTRAVPDESFVTVGAGISGDTETTFQNGLSYYGSDTDWTGFDDGTRDAPAALQAFYDSGDRIDELSQLDKETIGKSLIDPNIVTLQKIGDLPANFSASISGGTAFDVGDDGRLGIIATASYGNKWRNRDITSQTGNVQGDGTLAVQTDFNDFVTDNRITVNGLLGIGLEIGEHRFRLTNVYIRDTQKQASLSQGYDSYSGFDLQVQDTAWYERQLIDSQFVGELEFGPLSVDLRGGYAQTDRESPFESHFEYARTNQPADPYGQYFINLLDGNIGTANVAFSDLTEKLWYGGIDVGYEITPEIHGTVGYAYSDTSRYSERRDFLFRANGLGVPQLRGIGLLQPRFLLQPANFDYRQAAIDNNTNNPNNPTLPIFSINVIEQTQNNPAFDAALKIHGAYGLLDLTPMDGLTVNVGVRYEDAEQSVTPAVLFTNPVNIGSLASSNLKNDYFFPGATVTFEATDSLQLRLSASKTVARPQFRELIYQPYSDPENNRSYLGNPALVDSELVNAEARVEYYLPNRSRVSLAGFYKDIDNPIEAYTSFTDNNPIISFANAPSAQLYGGELEFEYNYDLFDIGGWFETKQIVAIANYTYTQSELKVGANDTILLFNPGQGAVEQPASNFFIDGVPLNGQSDHLVNLQLSLEDTDVLQQFTVLMTYASERVTFRVGGGNGGLPDVVEKPGFRLDLVARQGLDLFGSEAEFKLEARNILGTGHEEFQKLNGTRIDFQKYDIGQSFAASLSITF